MIIETSKKNQFQKDYNSYKEISNSEWPFQVLERSQYLKMLQLPLESFDKINAMRPTRKSWEETIATVEDAQNAMCLAEALMNHEYVISEMNLEYKKALVQKAIKGDVDEKKLEQMKQWIEIHEALYKSYKEAVVEPIVNYRLNNLPEYYNSLNDSQILVGTSIYKSLMESELNGDWHFSQTSPNELKTLLENGALLSDSIRNGNDKQKTIYINGKKFPVEVAYDEMDGIIARSMDAINTMDTDIYHLETQINVIDSMIVKYVTNNAPKEVPSNMSPQTLTALIDRYTKKRFPSYENGKKALDEMKATLSNFKTRMQKYETDAYYYLGGKRNRLDSMHTSIQQHELGNRKDTEIKIQKVNDALQEYYNARNDVAINLEQITKYGLPSSLAKDKMGKNDQESNVKREENQRMIERLMNANDRLEDVKQFIIPSLEKELSHLYVSYVNENVENIIQKKQESEIESRLTSEYKRLKKVLDSTKKSIAETKEGFQLGDKQYQIKVKRSGNGVQLDCKRERGVTVEEKGNVKKTTENKSERFNDEIKMGNATRKLYTQDLSYHKAVFMQKKEEKGIFDHDNLKLVETSTMGAYDKKMSMNTRMTGLRTYSESIALTGLEKAMKLAAFKKDSELSIIDGKVTLGSMSESASMKQNGLYKINVGGSLISGRVNVFETFGVGKNVGSVSMNPLEKTFEYIKEINSKLSALFSNKNQKSDKNIDLKYEDVKSFFTAADKQERLNGIVMKYIEATMEEQQEMKNDAIKSHGSHELEMLDQQIFHETLIIANELDQVLAQHVLENDQEQTQEKDVLQFTEEQGIVLEDGQEEEQEEVLD